MNNDERLSRILEEETQQNLNFIQNKPKLEAYLICVGRSLNNYSYDPVVVLNNIDYFVDSYKKGISVNNALDKFSEYRDEKHL